MHKSVIYFLWSKNERYSNHLMQWKFLRALPTTKDRWLWSCLRFVCRNILSYHMLYCYTVLLLYESSHMEWKQEKFFNWTPSGESCILTIAASSSLKGAFLTEFCSAIWLLTWIHVSIAKFEPWSCYDIHWRSFLTTAPPITPWSLTAGITHSPEVNSSSMALNSKEHTLFTSSQHSWMDTSSFHGFQLTTERVFTAAPLRSFKSR